MTDPQTVSGMALDELIELTLQGNASDDVRAEMEARLLSSADDRETWLEYTNLHGTLRRQFAFDVSAELVQPVRSTVPVRAVTPRESLPAAFWTVGWGLVTLALLAALIVWQPGETPLVTTITRLDGTAFRVADSGEITGLRVRERLRGGTVTIPENSLAELEFPDGSTISVSGRSVLVLPDAARIEMRLERGVLSASVRTQPARQPFIVHTPVADIRVIGTQFDVVADADRTSVSVDRGMVEVLRLADERIATVQQTHRVVASRNTRDRFVAMPIVSPADQWVPNLQKANDGQWVSREDLATRLRFAVRFGSVTRGEAGKLLGGAGLRKAGGSLHAVPVRSGGATVHRIRLAVADGQSEPVGLSRGSRFRIQGIVQTPADVTFALTAIDADKQRTLYITRRRVDGEFNLDLSLRDFRLTDAAMQRPGLTHLTCSTESDVMLQLTRLEVLPK